VTFFSEILDGTRARFKANLHFDIWEALTELADDEDGLIHTDPLTATNAIIARVYNESGPGSSTSRS
jgi:hypothetical protein